jgi:hypothetical protein
MAVLTIDYRWDNGRFWLSFHDCPVPTTTSQNLEVKQQGRTFGIKKSKSTNVSMRELMHQEQTNLPIASEIESMQDSVFEFMGEQVLLEG